MLDILGDYCNFKKWKFCRLDGSMNFLDRQANIDKFNQDPEYCIFLLSTRYNTYLSLPFLPCVTFIYFMEYLIVVGITSLLLFVIISGKVYRNNSADYLNHFNSNI